MGLLEELRDLEPEHGVFAVKDEETAERISKSWKKRKKSEQGKKSSELQKEEPGDE